MTGSTQQRLRVLSRDTHFLGKMAVTIVFSFAALSFLFSNLSSTPAGNEEGRSGGSRSEAVVQQMRDLVRPFVQGEASDSALLEAITDQLLERLSAEDLTRLVLKSFRDSVIQNRPLRRLTAEAEKTPPTRFANELLGDLASWHGEPERALAYYQAESVLPDADYARWRVIRILLDQERYEDLRETLRDERFMPTDPRRVVDLGVQLRDPGLVLQGVILVDYERMDPLLSALTLFSAAVWFVILFKLCEIPRFRSSAMVVALIAVLLGICSATATLFAVVWQENVLGLESDGTFIADLLYVICGIALREEVVKLAFFLPLVPWLYRRRDPKLVILAASCVGLGFALQENLGYFEGGQLPVVLRFLSANFAHTAMTGILGYTVVRFLYHPGREWERLLATFIGVVLVHGFYNGFLMIPQFAEYSVLSFIILIGLAFYYFDLITRVCPKVHPIISPLGVFVIGTAFVLGFAIMASCWIEPDFAFALRNVGNEFISSFALVALYISRFRTH